MARSYCFELIVLCGECGVRKSEACHLRWSDWIPEKGPHGAILWRGEHQKNGQSRITPVTPLVREALEAHRDRVLADGKGVPGPDDPMFPAPKSDGSVRPDVAHTWFLRAEKGAGYEHRDQGGFHELRRRWASKRKHLSPVDVAKVGGWKDVKTMQRSYQHADEETMERVMLDPGRQRTARM